jgi:hypothetical protein
LLFWYFFESRVSWMTGDWDWKCRIRGGDVTEQFVGLELGVTQGASLGN